MQGRGFYRAAVAARIGIRSLLRSARRRSGRSVPTAFRFGPRALCVAAAVVLGLQSCSKHSETDLQAVLDRLENDRRRHDPVEFVEIDLGEYTVTRKLPDTYETLMMHIHLYGVVPREQRDDVSRSLELRGNRMRESILDVFRQSETDHLMNGRLLWLKSQLVPTINKTLRSRAVRDVVFGDLSVEQV